MTTCATVQTAWTTKIFNHASIQAITTAIIYHPITQTSESEVDDLYFGAEVNVIEVLISRAIELVMTKEELTSYSVRVSYYKEQDPGSTNYADARAFFETLYPLVKSELGTTWNGTVDYWNINAESVDAEETTIDGRACWKVSATFEGILAQAY
jgi:hypothetical protein